MTHVHLLQIYDGEKSFRSLSCILKFKIFQHVIDGISDSCIEIVAFLSFYEATANREKVVQLERLFLSTQKIYSEIKKSLKLRVKTKGNLSFIADYICTRIHVSNIMQLQLMPFLKIDKDGKKIVSSVDVIFDGVKILGQLPHIDNIK